LHQEPRAHADFGGVIPSLELPVGADLVLLEQRLEAQIARMDARVDELLLCARTPTDDEILEVDVLCASIAEAAELLAEARAGATWLRRAA
jgi:hypothetical protein